MKLSKLWYLLLLPGMLFLTSCNDDDDPIIENEEEVITTMTYSLSPMGGGDAVTLSFVDLDGDGGDVPTITGGTLAANTTYNGVLSLLNEAEANVENITEEIEEEDEEHQFFFASTVSGLSVSYGDQDPSGNPVGLVTTLTTGAAANGTLTVTLRHEPNKTASGVSDGNIENAGGETDIEVTFDINVQ